MYFIKDTNQGDKIVLLTIFLYNNYFLLKAKDYTKNALLHIVCFLPVVIISFDILFN